MASSSSSSSHRRLPPPPPLSAWPVSVLRHSLVPKKRKSSSCSSSASSSNSFSFLSPGVCVPSSSALSAALRALLPVLGASSSAGCDLLGEGWEYLYLRLRLQYVYVEPKARPLRIVLPYSYHSRNVEVCLFVTKPQRKWKDAIRRCELRYVQKVIGIDKITKHTSSPKNQSNLCAAYDMFFADSAIVTMMPQLLGQKFREKHKMPVPLKFNEKTLKEDMEEAMRCAFVPIPKSRTMNIRFARTDMPLSEIQANAEAVIAYLSTFLRKPTPWKNHVFTIDVRGGSTPAIPVFVHPMLQQSLLYHLHNEPPTTQDK